MLLRRSMAFSHVVYASVFPILAAVLALVGIAILALGFADTPRTLKVAVGPQGGVDALLIDAFARRLAHDHTDLQLTVTTVSSSVEAAKALQSGDADLAVIRSDSTVPASALTVAVLHNDVAVLAAPHDSGIAKPAKLSGKRVGIFPADAANATLLDAVLAEYKIAAPGVEHVMLSADDLAHASADKKIDALFAVGPLHGPTIESAVASLSAGKRDPVLIPIEAADGMAARSAAYRKVDLPNGFFPGAPPLPSEDFATLGIAVSLEARQTLSDRTVTDLTKRLFDMRRLIEADAPIAAGIEKPEGEKGSLAAVHPGAVAYYGDDEKSFMDLYGDWIYIGAMALSGLGSAAAAMVGLTRARARKDALALICSLIELKQAAHLAMSTPRLTELDGQIEELSTNGLRFARKHDFDEAGLSALRLAIDEARRAVDDRCNELQQKSALANAAATRSLPYPVPSPDN
jgi:TRAP transporter TAXI family solute receptor